MTLERDIHFVFHELAARRVSAAMAHGLLKQVIMIHGAIPWGRLVLFEQWLDAVWRRYERLDLSLHDLATQILARLQVLVSRGGRRPELHFAVVVPLSARRS